MEAVEDAFLEGVILWLAQTILQSLFTGKLDEWIRQVGLADDAEKLKSEVERAEAVAAAVKGRTIGNRALARSLARLREVLYDADDVVDELDYYRLQHQVEGVTLHSAIEQEGMGGDGEQQVDAARDSVAMLPSSSDRKKRSKAWEEFRVKESADGKPVKAECIHCGTLVRCETTKGTSVLHNHLKSESCKRKRAAIEQTPDPPSAGDGAQNGATVSTHNSDIRKRMRIVEVSAHNTAAKAHAWTKAEFCNKIQQTTYQLRKATNEIQMLSVSGSVAYSNLCGNTTADPCRRTSSVVQCKMYGRVDEKNSIIKSMTEVKFDDVIIIPIVGMGGIGKTALSQLVYNDPIVKSQFDHRMWIWVSSKFDEVRLTMEMLDFVSQEKCVGIRSLAKLQEILVTHVTSNRTLVVLDDVWDDIDDCRWNKLLAPLRSDNAKGNVIIMTTRKLSIAKRICTVEPVKLGHLQNDDFWLLFKTCAFGDENYKEHPSITIMGQQIAKNLHGNPQAAQTAGMLLREHLTTDHWSHILKNEKWKSLQLNGGIMHALKLSYDELPFYLQQCFLYCSIFPNDHQFISSELIYIWIAQGFVKCSCSTERLEEMGQRYLTDLLNFGFFEQVETKDPTLGDKILYVMPALMHDFARLVSGNECAAIDDLTCREILPTIRHLSILIYSAYQEDKYGDILRNEKFEGKLQRVVNSTRKLRTLLLIGKYDCFFLQCLQGLFQKAQNLRALLISAAYADFRYSECNLVNSTHVRYLKLRTEEDNEPLPEALSKFYHLQVLDIGLDRYSTVHNGMNNLISLRHLVASKEVFSSISRIGKMTSLQELHDFKVDNCSSFEIAQLHSMSELAQLGVSQLEKVVTREEAYGANLRGKSHLEKLHLSWEYISQLEYYISIISEPYEVEEIGTSKVVLEGLEPHHSLKHLQISGYRSSTSPNWLVSTVSVTCLQTLHLEDCRELEVLPSVEKLPLLTKLKLSNMWKVRQVTVPSLEELVLIYMPKLECCSCNSVMDLNSSLRVLKFEHCHVLKVFPLFESWKKLKIERKSWLSCVKELTICECPHLMVPNPLPPSSNVCKLHITRVSTLPTMEGSSSEKLVIGIHDGLTELDDRTWREIGKNDGLTELDDRTWREIGKNDGLTELDDRILSFHNLRALSRLHIAGCQKLSSISLEGFRQLISLKTMDISYCFNLFSSDVPPPPEHTHEDMTDINFNALPSLKHLRIQFCGITGMWLSVMLRHAPTLEELCLYHCDQISGVLIEVGDSSSSNHTSAPRAPSAGNPDDALTSSTPDGLLRIPSNLIPCLKNMTILSCGELTFQGNKDGFSVFTSLEELTIRGCPKLIRSLVQTYENNDQRNGRWLLPYSLGKLDIEESPATLQPCFLEDHNCLKKLEINNSPSLKLLQLRSCTALEELMVCDCASLAALEGNFTCLKKLELVDNSGLESLQLSTCTALEELTIRKYASLATLEGNFTCLRKLNLDQNPRLTLQLRSCAALEELIVYNGASLTALEGNFTCLKKLVLMNLKLVGNSANSGLESLHLSTCTALEELDITSQSLATLEGNFTCLRKLDLYYIPRLKSLQLHSCAALEELKVHCCASLATLEGNFTCLRKLNLCHNPRLMLQLRSCAALEELMVYDCASLAALEGNFTCLKELEPVDNSGLESLQLCAYTALKKLMITKCASLTALEGNFTCLKELELVDNSGLKSLQLCTSTALEKLAIYRCASLTALEGNFTCLKKLELVDNLGLESLQLSTCTALEELTIRKCASLATLEGNFTCLRKLNMYHNQRLTLQLPEKGLPPSLEEIEISSDCEELADECIMLARRRSKLKVKIGGTYVKL